MSNEETHCEDCRTWEPFTEDDGESGWCATRHKATSAFDTCYSPMPRVNGKDAKCKSLNISPTMT